MITLNGVLVEATHFPDNTSQVWKLPAIAFTQAETAYVVWTFEFESEFMELAQLKTLLDPQYTNINLTLTYLPYGRQDKEVSNDATFGLATFAKLLNTLDFATVEILDPHSNVALKLIDRSFAVFPLLPLSDVERAVKADLICYPDTGAALKYTKVYPSFRGKAIFGEKVRDQATGHISKYTLKGNPKGKNVLIVDDICDGGMTFILLAKALYDKGATEVNLFVTHGLFTKGLRCLHEAGIKRIFTHAGEAKLHRGDIVIKKGAFK